MDYFSIAPDLIIHKVISYLTDPEIAKISSVSTLFLSKSTEHFSALLNSYRLQYTSPIFTFGQVYSQRVKIIDSWNTETTSTQFLPYNLVKSIKFGSDFFIVLKYDGSIYSNISGHPSLLDQDIEEIEASFQGFIMKKRSGEVVWVRKSLEGLISKTWPGETPSVISASLYGVVGLDSGQVVLFDRDYSREVNFSKNPGKILGIKGTPKMLLILGEDRCLYLCGLITFEAVAVINCNVREFDIGHTHSLALIQDRIRPFIEWSTEELLNFMRKNGFEDCCQLIKNHEIDGKDLKDLSDKYFIETLGIREPDRRNKLKYLLKQVNSSTFSKDFSILAWGRNNFLQIGPDISTTSSPTKIILPKISDDSIKSIHCDKQFSYTLTDKGRVLALGGKSGNKLSKAEKKNIIWEDVTANLLDKGTVSKIESSQMFLGIIYRPAEKNKEKVKMRMAEECFKLALSGSLPLDSYEIGYLDRFLGLLEMNLQEFSKTDVPKHRIQYFKRKGRIVWDRRSRLDNF